MSTRSLEEFLFNCSEFGLTVIMIAGWRSDLTRQYSPLHYLCITYLCVELRRGGLVTAPLLPIIIT